MLNDLKVSSSIRGQVPQYYPNEYPNLVNFLKDYYKFLEVNSNPLDLINSTLDLVDIDTYSGVDLTATLTAPVLQGQSEITVLDYVEFPKNDGLLKINDEVILYKTREHVLDGETKLTVFKECKRGFTYNDLDIDTGFTANISTIDVSHSVTSVVYNQSYAYVLYFLEKLRAQYLSDFPKNILADNLNNVNFNLLLKRIKDFYLSKGTPSGIDFYFKFLFQKQPQLLNYNEYLMAPSDAIYQSKNIVRIQTLDDYYIPELSGNSLIQLNTEYPVQTTENVYTFASQVYEAEIANAETIVPTNFTIITAQIQENKLYVDSTYGFANSGFLRINNSIVEYSDKEENYFVIDNLPEYYAVSDKVYEGRTLATVKDRPDSYFVIYAGVLGFEIDKNYTYYQKGDFGFVSDVIEETDLLVSGWQFNDVLPVELRYDYLPGITSAYTDEDAVYLYTSGLPYYDIAPSTTLNNKNVLIEDARILKKIPRTFKKTSEGFRFSTQPNSPVGFLRDGTVIYNWKSSTTFIRGGVKRIDIVDGGDNYNVNNPPTLSIDSPLDNSGTGASASLIVNGGVKEVYVLDSGQGYPSNTLVTLEKDPTDNVYTGENFRPATLQAIVVKGKISKIRVVDPGFGYTKQPTISISPSYNITRNQLPVGTTVPFDAVVDLFVGGPIGQVVIDDPGSFYDRDPNYEVSYGVAASASITIENGRIVEAQVVNAGNGYNSSPIVEVVDESGQGFGGRIYAQWNAQTKSIDDYVVLNAGINYSNINTVAKIYESGSGAIFNISVESWNLINNWNTANDFYYFNNNGGYLYGDNVISTDTGTKFGKKYSVLGFPRELGLTNPQTGKVETIALNTNTGHSPIIGFALDGAPIYGPFGYENPLDANSDVIRMVSGYQIKSNAETPAIRNVGILGTYTKGSFQEDYKWNINVATLDRQNGRYCITPEYPNGVYAYFMTVNRNNKRIGYPYFIGPEFAGEVYEEFNFLEGIRPENLTNVKRYLSPYSNSVPKPLDVGKFQVSGVPISDDAKVDSVSVISSGTGYKIGDTVTFDDSDTGGFGAAGFVSILRGKPVTSVTSDLYDLLEYKDENIPFGVGATIKTADGFTADIYAIDQINKKAYLENVSGDVPVRDEVIYDNDLTTQLLTFTELTGVDVSTVAIGTTQQTAALVNNITQSTKLIELKTFANCTINDFFSNYKRIIKINNEYMRVLKIDITNNTALVERGYESFVTSHSADDPIVLLDEIDVFDSSEFLINDIIKIDNEIFKVVNIRVEKQYEVVATKIDDGTGTQFGTQYYLYLNGVKQENSNAPIGVPFDQAVVQLNNDGDIEDLIFDTNIYTYAANPTAVISTSATYPTEQQLLANPNLIVPNTDIKASTYKHTLVLERQAYDSIIAAHYPRTSVYRLTFVNARVQSYSTNQRLARLSVQNSDIVLNENISISAATAQTVNYTISYAYNGGNPILTGIGTSLVLYENSNYVFELDPSSDNIFVNFYTPSNTTTKQKEYFDLDIERVYDISDNLERFTLRPKDYNLTELVMRISGSNGFHIDVKLNITPEPINGDYIVVNSSPSFIEVPVETNLLFESLYNQTNIKYTTISKTASGGIDVVTLSSGGFGYNTVPSISGVESVSGTGAILESVSNNIGLINSIVAVNSGYGYNPNPALKPTLVFPRIAKINRNFIVKSVALTNKGEGFLFTPNIVVSGGGLGSGSSDHAVLTPIITNEVFSGVSVDFSGVGYSTAPTITVEKLFFCTVNANGEILFKFSFRRYIRDDDSFILRAFYNDANGDLQSADSTVTFYATLGSSTVSAKLLPGSQLAVNPRDYITTPEEPLYYQLILAERTAELTAIVEKSTFIAGEKVIFNDNPALFGFVSRQQGWQPNNSILRIEKTNYEAKVNDRVTGASSSSFGYISETFGVECDGTLNALIETPKQFLNSKSFLGINALKIQDSFRYQKYAYEIGIDVPFNNWKDNYQKAAHPTGFNLFAKTAITNAITAKPSAATTVKISTDISSVARLKQKNNYIIARNAGFDEVEVINRLLTDVKELKSSVVATFEDFSSQFDGVKSTFELKILDPITQTYLENDQYDIDQMVVSLDNIIQSYGTSWTVIDSSKEFNFTSVQQAGELLPSGEILTYRQFNEDAVIYNYAETSTSVTDTFTIRQQDTNLFPGSVYAPIVAEKWLVFVDGVHQQASSYTLTTDTITFSEDISTDSQISVRYISSLLANDFTSGSVTSGVAVALSNKPSITSKESYFVFVDGMLLSTSDYELDSNNNVVFNYGFTYDSLSVCIDSLGVSLDSSTHVLIENLYRYKIEDGSTEIPAGFSLNPEDYIVDIAGIIQTPFIAYSSATSGVRQILFNEPPQRYVDPDRVSGRQFIGLLYQREDAAGVTSTPNFQFDDVSRNIIHLKDNPQDFIIGDYVNTSTSSAAIVEKSVSTNRKVVETGYSGSVASSATFDIIVSDIKRLYVGDRVKFNSAFGMTSILDNELEISAIDRLTKTVTITNISPSTLTISIQQDTSIRFNRIYLVVDQLETTVPDRDDAFVANDTLLSGFISSQKTGITTIANEPFGILDVDTEITVNNASVFAQNDYVLLNNSEVVKITNIVSNTLTIVRSQLKTEASLSYGNGITVEKIIPQEVTVSQFFRGFDGDKTTFVLAEQEQPVFIEANKDLFIIVNGVLQIRGSSYQLNEVGGPSPYTEIVFFEPPQARTPFNAFYVGETIAIQDISPQFNGVDTLFDLRSTTGEIFSLLVQNYPDINVSANLLLFIDGVYQIPSSNLGDGVQSYPDSVSAFQLLGSSIEFTSAPRSGSSFEGYIFVGSSNDYKSTDIDATIEDGDIIIQSNEISPRKIFNITSATKMSVNTSSGVIDTTPNAGIEIAAGDYGWWKTDVLKVTRIRESLRARRTIPSTIIGFGGSSPYPLSGKTLYTISLQTIELDDLSSDLPQSPDDDSNLISFILPATANFPERAINATYTTYVPRLTSSSGSDELQGVKVGFDLPFNQILKLSGASAETFEDPSFVGWGVKPYIQITYGAGKTASIVNWDITNQIIYLYLDDPLTPLTTADTLEGYTITDDSLVNEYQTLQIGDKSIYNF